MDDDEAERFRQLEATIGATKFVIGGPAPAAAAPQPDELLLHGGQTHLAARYALRKALRIGRSERVGDETNDVVLAWDETVSSRHARLELRGGQWFVLDLGSRNGVFVDGRRIDRELALRGGESIVIGGAELTFVSRGRALPFPLAVTRALVSAQQGPLAVAKSVCDSLDTVLRFFAAVELGALLARPDPARLAAVAGAFAGVRAKMSRGQPFTMGDWKNLGFALASVLGPAEDERVRAVARAFTNANGSPTSLGQRIGATITWRNGQLAHAPLVAEESFSVEQPRLTATWDDVCEAMAPLASFELVSRKSLVDTDLEAMTYEYDLLLHQGAQELFPVVRRTLRRRLSEGWCYLVGDPDNVVSLEPIVGVGLGERTQKIEVGVAEHVSLAPRALIQLRGVASTATFRREVPATKPFEALAALLA